MRVEKLFKGKIAFVEGFTVLSFQRSFPSTGLVTELKTGTR